MSGSVTSDHFAWNWKGEAVEVGLDRLGAGATLLLLPAFSSISTRREMRPLQERLPSDFATLAIDLPGFWRRAPATDPVAACRLCCLFAARPYACGCPPPRHDSCRACRKLCPLGGCRISELNRAALPDRSNLARTSSDRDGWA